MGRWCNCMHMPRKKIAACLIALLFTVFTVTVLSTSGVRLHREHRMEKMFAGIQSQLQFLESQYRGRLEDIASLQAKIFSYSNNSNTSQLPVVNISTSTVPPDVLVILKNLTGSKTASGIQTKNLQQLRTPFVYQLLPHLMNDPHSLKPAYHMRGRSFSEIVVGVPTVKRDKESYLMVTLSHLLSGLTSDDTNNTLIVVMVGETDLKFVINIARQIEITYPAAVESGLIEVISPRASYYPDLDSLPVNLGDSHQRVKWRTKQNLDTIYLMAYAQSKGIFYLMLEDDVIAKNHYIHEIKQFTAATSVTNPNWFFIDYSQVGGIGKLFHSADLLQFITYVQLFYNNMPIDWLLESYLADKVCSIAKLTKPCSSEKEKIRPKYKSSLFQHIGLYSSLKGKVHKIKVPQFGDVPTFHPHINNPPLQSIKTEIVEYADHTLKGAYSGQTYFWGVKPKKGDFIEFWFKKPVTISRYTFRSANIDHAMDKFYNTSVEVLQVHGLNFTRVGKFDEFGLADGDLSMGPISAIRLTVNRASKYWVILSEIHIVPQYSPTPETR